MAHIVYAPTAKGLKKRAFRTERDRIVLLGDGTAAWWTGTVLTQSDLLYRGPDSHIKATTEELPKTLMATRLEIAHMAEHNIVLPFEVTPIK